MAQAKLTSKNFGITSRDKQATLPAYLLTRQRVTRAYVRKQADLPLIQSAQQRVSASHQHPRTVVIMHTSNAVIGSGDPDSLSEAVVDCPYPYTFSPFRPISHRSYVRSWRSRVALHCLYARGKAERRCALCILVHCSVSLISDLLSRAFPGPSGMSPLTWDYS